MLKYSLVENAVTTDTKTCVAVVSSPESRNLDDVISYMVSEGTGLNRLASFRFIPVLLFIFCLSWGGCKSVPVQKSVEALSERDERIQKDVDSLVTTSRKTNASSNGMQQSLTQQLSEFTDKSNITVNQKSDERQQQAPGKDPYRWRYLALAIVVVIIITGGIYKFTPRL